MEPDLVFVRGSKSTSVLCTGRKLVGFNLWVEIDLIFSMGIDIALFFVYGPKLTCFLCGDRVTSFLCGWSKLTWF